MLQVRHRRHQACTRQTSPHRVMHRGRVGFDSLFFFWLDGQHIRGDSSACIPLRWPQVSPRVVVRWFHNARDNPPTDKVPGGRSVKSAQALQASPAGASMLPFPPRPSMKTYHKSCPPPPPSVEAAFPPRPSISSPLAHKRATRPTAPAKTNDSCDSSLLACKRATRSPAWT